MIPDERPDLSNVDPAVRSYIEALEAELVRFSKPARAQRAAEPAEIVGPAEPPTTANVVTITRAGLAKRTPRHLYPRQLRGGMGVFDIETPEEDPPALLLTADEADTLVVVTDRGRAFRLPMQALPETLVRGRGVALASLISLNPGERPAAALADGGGPYLALLTERGQIRWLGAHLVGPRLSQGMILYDADALGAPASACWTSNEEELFIVTAQGQGIRFAARLVPARGCLGIRLGRDDVAVAITPVQEDSGVLLAAADGKGTVRLMSGFAANKAPGASGKAAMKTVCLVAAAAVPSGSDVFIISRLSKMIRFAIDEIPPKEGLVQGVNCMALRSDEAVAATVAQLSG